MKESKIKVGKVNVVIVNPQSQNQKEIITKAMIQFFQEVEKTK